MEQYITAKELKTFIKDNKHKENFCVIAKIKNSYMSVQVDLEALEYQLNEIINVEKEPDYKIPYYIKREKYICLGSV